MVSLNVLAHSIYENNISKGFYEPLSRDIQEIGLEIYSKVAYLIGCLEAARKGLETPTRYILDPTYYTDEELLAAIKFLLITSEAVEAFDELVAGDRDHEAEEIADIIIRVLDYAGWRNLNVDKALSEKMEKNKHRPYKHNRKF